MSDSGSILVAIDPGPTRSAWCTYDFEARRIRSHGTVTNERLLDKLRGAPPSIPLAVIEKVEGYGMPVGVEVFETVRWAGRFEEALDGHFIRVVRVGRKAIKINLCGSVRAKDANVRQALIDRFGGASAIGRKANPGPLYGITGDAWAALAVAVAYSEGAR